MRHPARRFKVVVWPNPISFQTSKRVRRLGKLGPSNEKNGFSFSLISPKVRSWAFT